MKPIKLAIISGLAGNARLAVGHKVVGPSLSVAIPTSAMAALDATLAPVRQVQAELLHQHALEDISSLTAQLTASGGHVDQL